MPRDDAPAGRPRRERPLTRWQMAINVFQDHRAALEKLIAKSRAVQDRIVALETRLAFAEARLAVVESSRVTLPATAAGGEAATSAPTNALATPRAPPTPATPR